MSKSASIPIASIQLDTTIQCRADIDIATVNEYSEAMQEGVEFPPVELYGTAEKSWIGDGWHRVMAAKSIDIPEISANLHPGGRMEALRAALAANAAHGRRRTNADKRCAVAIALREWPNKTDLEIAETCAVSHPFVAGLRRTLQPMCNGYTSEPRQRRDGTTYTVRQQPKDTQPKEAAPEPARKLGPPRVGMQFARMALMDLEQIRPDDAEREQAFAQVLDWMTGRMAPADSLDEAEAAMRQAQLALDDAVAAVDWRSKSTDQLPLLGKVVQLATAAINTATVYKATCIKRLAELDAAPAGEAKT